MNPFREHVAIAIDGGGIRGLIIAHALEILEQELGKSPHGIFRLAAGTSTGSIIAAGIGAGLTGERMTSLYMKLGPAIFQKSLRSRLWPLTRYRYPIGPLEDTLKKYLGEMTMDDFWSADPPTDVVITVFDLVENRARFIKPWKPEYKAWPVVTAVLASCVVPTYFPVVEGRYVDGGIGGYGNPCFLAAYEIGNYLSSDRGSSWGWNLKDTTLISLGTGRAPHTLPDADRLWPWQWLNPLLGDILLSANDHEVHLVDTFYESLDFRRFQVDLDEPIEMDEADPATIGKLLNYGEKLAEKILNDDFDLVQKEHKPFKIV